MKRAHYETLQAHDKDYWWFRTRHDAVIRFLRSKSERGLLLDVGCGAGGFLRRCLDDGLRAPDDVLGLDVDAASVAAARKRGVHAEVMPAADLSSVLPAPPAAITMLDVLEHIEDPHPLLEDLRAAAAPGAMLVVLVPALKALWSPWDDRLGHFRRYDRSMIRDTLSRAGWKVRHTRYLFPSMVLPGLLRARMLQRKTLPADEFPVVTPLANRLLHTATTIEATLPWWPAGTSLAAVAQAASDPKASLTPC